MSDFLKGFIFFFNPENFGVVIGAISLIVISVFVVVFIGCALVSLFESVFGAK